MPALIKIKKGLEKTYQPASQSTVSFSHRRAKWRCFTEKLQGLLAIELATNRMLIMVTAIAEKYLFNTEYMLKKPEPSNV